MAVSQLSISFFLNWRKILMRKNNQNKTKNPLWKVVEELGNQVQRISERQNMKRKLANVKYVAVEFAYDHFKNGENEVNNALEHGYEVMETHKSDSGIVVVLGLYRFGAI